MSYFDIDPRAADDMLHQARQNPVLMPDPGLFDGSATATGKGLFQGVIAQPALVTAEAATPFLRPVARAIDDLFGSTSEAWLLDEQRKTVQMVKDLMPDESVGFVGQLGYGLTTTLPQAAAGYAFGGPAGAAATIGSLSGYSSFRVAQEKGVDEGTALAQGAIEGAAMAAGVAIPGAVPGSLVKSIGVGVGGNVGLGMVSRGAVGSVLEANGYEDMAKQYQAFDSTSIAVDAVLGAAFGVVGSRAKRLDVSPAAVNEALAVAADHHTKIDVAPGIPTDPASQTAHGKALAKAVEDVASGRPVDVSPTGIADAEFLTSRLQVVSEVSRAVKELNPLASVLDEVEQLRAKVIEMGLEPVDEPLISGERAMPPTVEVTPEAPVQPAWYSGAPSGLVELDPALAREGNRYGRGVYLSQDAAFTETYSRGALDETGSRAEGGSTYQAEFSPQKPFNADAILSRKDAESILTQTGVDDKTVAKLLGKRPKVGGSTVFDALAKALGSRDMAAEALKAQGYDAVLFKDNRGNQLAVSFTKTPVRETAKVERKGDPVVATARAEMRAGNLPDRDIAPHAEAALELVPIVRGSGIDAITEGKDIFSQQAGPETIALLRSDNIEATVGKYYELAMRLENPRLADPLDPPAPSRAELIREAMDGDKPRPDELALAAIERDRSFRADDLELQRMEGEGGRPVEDVGANNADDLAVQQTLEAMPNAQTLDDAGQLRVAAGALAEADAVVAQAESDSAAFPAAVSCFLRG